MASGNEAVDPPFVRDTLDLSNGTDPFDRPLPVPSPYMADPYK